jgi:hypothetical protein
VGGLTWTKRVVLIATTTKPSFLNTNVSFRNVGAAVLLSYSMLAFLSMYL